MSDSQPPPPTEVSEERAFEGEETVDIPLDDVVTSPKDLPPPPLEDPVQSDTDDHPSVVATDDRAQK
jgi:hypothetical protein